MAYLGRGIENLSDRVVLDDITTSATATYNLTLNSVAFVPSSSESITCSVNGVIQKCGGTNPSFTVSGSQIIFSSALTSSDSIDFIIAERGITLQTPSAGSVNTEQLANDAVTFDKLSGQNYPAWFVHLNADQTGITDNVATKVQFDTEIFDTDNIYDNSTNYRITIPSGKAGKYYIESSVFVRHNPSSLNRAIAYIYKNGGIVNQVFLDFRNNPIQKTNVTVSAILDLAVNDYIEIYGFGDSTDSNDVEFGGEPNQKESYFQGFRIGD